MYIPFIKNYHVYSDSKGVNDMAFFDDSHYRLGRVTNMDSRSNKAMIELLENSIDELQD